MKDEINKIISWIEMSYTKLNYKEELLLVNYIKQLQQENKQLKEENKFLKSEIEEAKRIFQKYLEYIDERDKRIDKAIKLIEDTYYSKNTTNIDSIILSSDKLIKVREILKEVK